MDFLPKDPVILVSSVNMLLRDEEFDSLESLCYCYNRNPKELKDFLLKNGYIYSDEQKQIRPVGFDKQNV
jgi:phage antirepressor YoqD-like protein